MYLPVYNGLRCYGNKFSQSHFPHPLLLAYVPRIQLHHLDEGRHRFRHFWSR